MATIAKKILPRGIRNNNPLNIRLGSHWLGLADIQDDPEFCQFKTMVYGIRAAFRLLRSYIVTKKLNTIRLIVSRWAPSTENDTEKYIAEVVRITGIADNYVISFYDKEVMIKLFDAMCQVENGQKVPSVMVNNGYGLV